MLVERTHARLAGVIRDDLLHAPGRYRQLVLRYAVRLALLGHKMIGGYAQLVFENITRNVYHLHAVAKRGRDVAHVIGRGDEEHLRQVVLGVEIVVMEGGVLLGIENLQQRARRVAVVGYGYLVHLVEDDDRIRRAAALDRLDDAAGHGAYVCAAVSPDLGLVVQTAQRNAAELAAERSGDRLAQRRLAHARRAVEAENRRFEVAFEFDDGQMLHQSLLTSSRPKWSSSSWRRACCRSRLSGVVWSHGSSNMSCR